jgi:acyl carrier protein
VNIWNKIPSQVKHQEIFDKVRNIVAEDLEVNPEEIDLDYQLFIRETYDKRQVWGSSGSSSVVDFDWEEAEYYESRIITAASTSYFDIQALILDLEAEFNIEITDEIASYLTTIGKTVDYISNIIN